MDLLSMVMPYLIAWRSTLWVPILIEAVGWLAVTIWVLSRRRMVRFALIMVLWLAVARRFNER